MSSEQQPIADAINEVFNNAGITVPKFIQENDIDEIASDMFTRFGEKSIYTNTVYGIDIQIPDNFFQNRKTYSQRLDVLKAIIRQHAIQIRIEYFFDTDSILNKVVSKLTRDVMNSGDDYIINYRNEYFRIYYTNIKKQRDDFDSEGRNERHMQEEEIKNEIRKQVHDKMVRLGIIVNTQDTTHKAQGKKLSPNVIRTTTRITLPNDKRIRVVYMGKLGKQYILKNGHYVPLPKNAQICKKKK